MVDHRKGSQPDPRDFAEIIETDRMIDALSHGHRVDVDELTRLLSDARAETDSDIPAAPDMATVAAELEEQTSVWRQSKIIRGGAKAVAAGGASLTGLAIAGGMAAALAFGGIGYAALTTADRADDKVVAAESEEPESIDGLPQQTQQETQRDSHDTAQEKGDRKTGNDKADEKSDREKSDKTSKTTEAETTTETTDSTTTAAIEPGDDHAVLAEPTGPVTPEAVGMVGASETTGGATTGVTTEEAPIVVALNEIAEEIAAIEPVELAESPETKTQQKPAETQQAPAGSTDEQPTVLGSATY